MQRLRLVAREYEHRQSSHEWQEAIDGDNDTPAWLERLWVALKLTDPPCSASFQCFCSLID